MAAYVVHEFYTTPNARGEVEWPAEASTPVAAAGSHTTNASTKTVVITCDADSRVSFDGGAAAAQDIPLLTSAINQFEFQGGALTLKFL